MLKTHVFTELLSPDPHTCTSSVGQACASAPDRPCTLGEGANYFLDYTPSWFNQCIFYLAVRRNHTLRPEPISNCVVTTKSVLDRFEVTGAWQFDSYKKTAYGNVTYDKHDGIILQITHFRDDSSNNDELLSIINQGRYQRVVGNLTTGEIAVLEDATHMKTHLLSQGPITKSYRIKRMYVGKNPITNKFNQICVSYTSLLAWLAPDLREITESHGGTNIRIIPEKSIKMCLDGFDMEIECASNIEKSDKNLSVQHRAVVSMKMKGLYTLDNLYEPMLVRTP